MTESLICNLEHERPIRAVVKLEVKSSRAGRPGHPMVRLIAVCTSHARELRKFGIEVVGT